MHEGSLPHVVIRLKPGRERSVLSRHPWIFEGALAGVSEPVAGPAWAEVRSAQGEWLARGLFHPGSGLAVRLLSWSHDEPCDAAWIGARIRRAVAAREALPDAQDRPPETTAHRLVFAEADGVPGLIVDRYGPAVVARVGAAVLMPFLPHILSALRAMPGVTKIHVEADADATEREGIAPGELEKQSDECPGPVEFFENGLRFEMHPGRGQKTGYFLDQRVNRRRVGGWARGRRVLSVYSYTGAFELNAARAGATEILGVDASEPAILQAQRHHALNAVSLPVAYRAGDAPQILRRLRDEGRTFDLVILDPPRFVFSRAGKERGLRAYKDINLLGMKLLTPGGILATFSCSGIVSAQDFSEVVRWAAVDAHRDVQIVETLGQPADHPVLSTFPESGYLKGLIARVS